MNGNVKGLGINLCYNGVFRVGLIQEDDGARVSHAEMKPARDAAAALARHGPTLRGDGWT